MVNGVRRSGQLEAPNAYETIRFERQAEIATLALARPAKRNAQNPRMWRELRDLGGRLVGDETLRCLVVTGDGPSFSAGIDLVEGMAGAIGELAGRPPDERASAVAAAREAAGTFNWIPGLPCPSVAAVRGHAYGAGLQLALACDFRVFSETALVGLIETRFGLLPDMGATYRLPRIIGEGRARELILLGEIIDAAQALRIGLANRVVPDGDLEGAAYELAGRLAAQPPLAVRGARRAIDAAWYLDPDASFRVALEEQLRCIASEDFKEGRQALAEGRTPRWHGR
jgi:enoyl-CoA hydratase/carnithine racemase